MVMTDISTITIVLLLLLVGYLYHRIQNGEINDEYDEYETIEDSVEEELNHQPEQKIIVAHTQQIGVYKDHPFYQRIKTEDGEEFEFESIAVQGKPGIYHGDDPFGTYLVMDEILYKKVTA